MSPDESKMLEHLLKLREQLSLRHAIQEELIAFEHELCTNNRFFPRTNILSWVDAIAPMVYRTLAPGTTMFRGRIIPKTEEDVFLAPIYHALGVFVEGEKGDLRHTRLAEAYVQKEIERLGVGLAPLDFATLRNQLQALREKGWWGYNKQDSGAAPSDATGNGRINPIGISYLYAASRKETAALEARPVISQMVSIAEVVITEEVTLFDLTRNVFDDETPNEETKMFRKLLAHYFAKPNYSGDQAYLVTQYISEYIKGSIETTTGLRFDGLCFSSSLDRKGTNYVIFDTSEHPKYEIASSSLEKVADMQGSLETYLPISDETIRALMNGPF